MKDYTNVPKIQLKDVRPADPIFWHNTEESPWHSKQVNKHSEPIPGDELGYCHVGISDYNNRYILHAHPGRASKTLMDPEFFRNNSKFVLEVWELPGITDVERRIVVEEFRDNAFLKDKNGNFRYKKDGSLLGRRYDWLAIISFGKYNDPYLLHCAEITAISYCAIDKVLWPRGTINLVTQPNQIILSNKLKIKGIIQCPGE